MSLTYHPIRSERDVAIKDSAETGFGELGRGLDSISLRRSCTQQCLNSGRTLSQEEKACLSACFYRSGRLANKRHLII
jgi:hypothetical protein